MPGRNCFEQGNDKLAGKRSQHFHRTPGVPLMLLQRDLKLKSKPPRNRCYEAVHFLEVCLLLTAYCGAIFDAGLLQPLWPAAPTAATRNQ